MISFPCLVMAGLFIHIPYDLRYHSVIRGRIAYQRYFHLLKNKARNLRAFFTHVKETMLRGSALKALYSPLCLTP